MCGKLWKVKGVSVCESVCVCVCSPQFRFSDQVEPAAFDDDQPKKMLLKRDPDSCDVCDACAQSALHDRLFFIALSRAWNSLPH